MTINRNNYEEYFLLYADNELSATEKRVVEIFLQENVDLKEEFYMIQLTINTPEEDITLADKSFLLKKETSLVNENNYENIFVQYYDNELNEELKAATELFVKEHQQYKDEFELIGKAKLIPDESIVFPDKKLLYRKKRSGKVIPLMVWRSLAAAVLIGFGLWITVPYINKNDTHPAITTPSTIANNGNAHQQDSAGKNDQKNILPAENNNQKNSLAATNPVKQKEEKQKPLIKDHEVVMPQEKQHDQIAKNDAPVKDLNEDRPVLKELNTKDASREIAANIPQETSTDNLEKTNQKVEEVTAQALPVQQQVEEKPALAQHASYLPDGSGNNDNYVFYDVSSDDFNKTKLGGFIKKVKRIVKRNNPINHLFNTEEEEQVTAK